MTEHWTDRIVGDRMAVDQEFNDRVANSEFTRQQWGLIMTAVEFEIDGAADVDGARLVADTANLPAIIPELDEMDHPPGAMGPGGQNESGSSTAGNIVGGLKDAIGLGGGGDDDEFDRDQLEAAERLTQEYADRLQEHLEERDKWADVCEAVASADQ